MRYEFGKNWDEFERRHFGGASVESARRHLLHLLRRDSLDGLRFLDIGCGSGIHSLAALRAGAESIVSFDYDADSVATARRIWEREGSPAHWSVGRGDVLDRSFMQGLDPADVVYSWGVLHHTGDMWTALRNACIPLAADGVFYVALYSSDVYLDPPPEYWIALKKTYNRAGRLRRYAIEAKYVWRELIWPSLRRGRNPLAMIRGYRDQYRGMSYYVAVKDWLGGYPMEFAGNRETVEFARAELGLEALQVAAGEGCTEYVFRSRDSHNWWDAVWEAHPAFALEGPFESEGRAWRAAVPSEWGAGADWDLPLMVYEDGVPQGYSQTGSRDVRKHGRGRFHRHRSNLLFSASDDSDPNSNGRTYTVRPAMGWWTTA